jgi:hypothetical protein
MARLTPSQLNSLKRQMQQKQRQAIDKAKREIRAHNQKVHAHNQKLKQAVDKHNRDIRAHNARVRANQQRLRNEIERLNRLSTPARYVTFRASVNTVQSAYERLERAADTGRYDNSYDEILDLSEREAANNVGLMNALTNEAEAVDAPQDDNADGPLTPILSAVSVELGDRWQGALFSLSPKNPDAARHFCTSSREIIARILDAKAPDDAVTSAMPDYDRNQRGTPTRRAKIKYILHTRGLHQEELESFVEADMDNVLGLFQTFNEGTHGAAGKFNFQQLQAIRKRVEDGIVFLSRLINQ